MDKCFSNAYQQLWHIHFWWIKLNWKLSEVLTEVQRLEIPDTSFFKLKQLNILYLLNEVCFFSFFFFLYCYSPLLLQQFALVFLSFFHHSFIFCSFPLSSSLFLIIHKPLKATRRDRDKLSSSRKLQPKIGISPDLISNSGLLSVYTVAESNQAHASCLNQAGLFPLSNVISPSTPTTRSTQTADSTNGSSL